MATLAAAITATETLLSVGSPAQSLVSGQGVRVDDEVMEFEAYDTAEYSVPVSRGVAGYTGAGPRTGDALDYTRWRVRRAVDGSIAASHAQGATVQAAVDAFLAGTFGDPPGPFDGGAGGDFDIPGLPALATPDDADELPIEDVSAAVTKKVTVANLVGNIVMPETAPDGQYGQTFTPAGPNITGAILVLTGDPGDLTGNGYVMRIMDEVGGHQSFDLDAWGSMLIRGPLDPGDGSGGVDVIRQSDGSHVGFFSTRGDFVWRAHAADSTGSVLFVEDVVLLRSGDRVDIPGIAGIGFFDKSMNGPNPGPGVPQQELARPSGDAGALWDILEAYGLVKAP